MNEEKIKETNRSYSQTFEVSGYSIYDIFLLLSENIKYLVYIPLFTMVCVAINVTFFTESVYVSVSKFSSSSSSSNNSMSQAAGLAAQFGIAIPGSGAEQKILYPEIIKSRTIANKMLKRKFDTEKYGNEKSLFYILTDNQDITEESKTLAINKFINMIFIDDDLTGSIYTLKLSAFEPKLASDLSISLVEELQLHQNKYNMNKMSKTRQFIEERIYDTEKMLNLAEESLKDFRKQNRRIQNSPSLLLEQQRLEREVTVLIGVYTTLKQQLETFKIEEIRESDYINVLDPPSIPLSRFKPKKKIAIISAAILGLFIGIVFIFLKEYVSKISNADIKKIKQIKKNIIESI